MNKIFLFLTALIYLYLGGWALFFPAGFVDSVGLAITTNVGSGEVRSLYGGINFLIGLFSLLALVRSKYESSFFKILLFVITGILLGRIVTFIYGEFDSVFLLYFTVFELVYFVFLVTALRKQERKIF